MRTSYSVNDMTIHRIVEQEAGFTPILDFLPTFGRLAGFSPPADRVIDGVEIEFHLVPESEAPSEMISYYPQFKVLNMAEDTTHTLHNLYTLRGTKPRWALDYVESLNKVLALHPDIVFPSQRSSDVIHDIVSGQKPFPISGKSGILLYGSALLYGFTGTTAFDGIAVAMGDGVSNGELFGMVFLLAGLAFKMSAVPFHMWTPDVYQGAPTSVTAFMAVASKAASFGAFVELKDGIDGLVHISQISEERIDKVKDVLKPGQEVSARVIKIDREERRLGLSIKAANYSSEQLAAETSAYEALNRSAGNDMMNLGDILDEAAKKE